MAGNYAACPGFEDFTEDSETFEIGANRIYNGWLTAGMCDKHAIRTRMLLSRLHIFHIGKDNGIHFAPVFFCRFHGTVLYDDLGVEL